MNNLFKIRLENEKEVFYLIVDLHEWDNLCKKYYNYIITVVKKMD